MAKTKKLTDLKLAEVSGVGDPANPGAKILLVKNHNQEEVPMDKKELMTALEGAVAKALEPVVADAAITKALALMSDAEKAHYATLKGDAATAFVKMDAAARKDAMPAADDEETDDPVDPAAAAAKKKAKPAAKSAEAVLLEKSVKDLTKAEARLETLEKAATEAKLEKRATTELADVPGTLAEKVNLLKALEALPADAAKSTMDMVKGAGKLATQFTKMLGKQGHSAAADSPAAELNKLAAEHQKLHKDMTFHKAYAEVLATEKGQELYVASQA